MHGDCHTPTTSVAWVSRGRVTLISDVFVGSEGDRYIFVKPSCGLRGFAQKVLCERPPRSLRSRLPLTKGRITRSRLQFSLPLREGESRPRSASPIGQASSKGGRGSLTLTFVQSRVAPVFMVYPDFP